MSQRYWKAHLIQVSCSHEKEQVMNTGRCAIGEYNTRFSGILISRFRPHIRNEKDATFAPTSITMSDTEKAEKKLDIAIARFLSRIAHAGRNLGIEISSVQSSNVTTTGIPIASCSGAHLTRLVIIAGPSSSVTSATT